MTQTIVAPKKYEKNKKNSSFVISTPMTHRIDTKQWTNDVESISIVKQFITKKLAKKHLGHLALPTDYYIYGRKTLFDVGLIWRRFYIDGPNTTTGQASSEDIVFDVSLTLQVL